MKKTFNIKNLKQLSKLGKHISTLLQPNTLLFLKGEIGSGKTTLTKFIAHHLKIKENIQSPTFNILKQYSIVFEKKTILFNHYDLFRLKKEKELNALLKELKELAHENINIIEWGENDPQWMKTPGYNIIVVEITQKQKGDQRTLKLKEWHKDILDTIRT